MNRVGKYAVGVAIAVLCAWWSAQPAQAATYAHSWLTQRYSIPTTPDTTAQVTLTIKNTGTATWRNDGGSNTIRLGAAHPNDRASQLHDSSWLSTNRIASFAGRAQLNGSGQPVLDGGGNVVYDNTATTIAPGEAAHFVFTVRTPNHPYSANEYFNIVIDGVSWFPDLGIYWPVSIGQGFAAQWAGQGSFPSIDKGGNPISSLYFDYQNTGSFAWPQNGVVRLGTSQPLDRTSGFQVSGLSSGSDPALPANTSNWLSANRVASFAGKVTGGSLDTSATSIQPGETGRFFAALDARNATNGSHQEYFRLVADGFAWLQDYGAYQTVSVSSTGPKVAGAGDISCDPADASYNSGNGTSTNCRMKATSDLLVGAGYSKILALGDLQYEDGTLAKFNASYDPTWGRVKSDTAPAVGNHEYATADADGYFDYWGSAAGDPDEGYYSYDVGDWHLIALNSNCGEVSCSAGSAQEVWLRADLAANPARCTLAYWHHPRFSSGEHGSITDTAPLWQALDEFDTDVVLVGHDHNYERFHRQTPGGTISADGIRQFVVGSGGKNFRDFDTILASSAARNNTTFGVLELTLNPYSYDWNFRPIVGQSYSDSGATACR